MSKKRLLIALILLIVAGVKSYSQIAYSGKIELGYLAFKHQLLDVDPGPNYRGSHLDKGQNGKEISMSNGISIHDKWYTGIGVAYLNFEGINGISVYSDVDYRLLKTKLTPVFNMKLGYNHSWNQYENGTKSVLFELGVGVCYKLSKKRAIYIQSGFSVIQEASFTPFRIGFKF
ncbi:MAG: hypothetical protein COB98_07750 [Flavobacteriaceae bacterium]|nr:MAG: hypothetical protein COB98_07750 [Flavobacteriaceae bacterium]